MADLLRALLAVLLLAGAAQAECTVQGGLRFGVALERPAPYRVTLDQGGRRLLLAARVQRPPRLWPSGDPCVISVGVRPGPDGWPVLVAELDGRYRLRSAALRGATVDLWLERLDAGGPVAAQPTPTMPELPLIVIDPGHGGIDAGAVRDGLRESDLTLAFARALAEALIRSGAFRVELTRDEDVFVSLADRVAAARNARASAFLSLHADALEHGAARGGAVFTLSEQASDAAAEELVALHDRADVLIGQDLGGAGDQLAGVLIDLSRAETSPRSQALAGALVGEFDRMPGALRKGALRSANFGVLKAPDVPSVLVELGFMSDEGDLANLADPDWRAAAVAALRDGVLAWSRADALAAGLRRR